MTYILEVPLANDSPQVREIIECIRISRESVLEVGAVMTRHSSKEEIKEVEKD